MIIKNIKIKDLNNVTEFNKIIQWFDFNQNLVNIYYENISKSKNDTHFIQKNQNISYKLFNDTYTLATDIYVILNDYFITNNNYKKIITIIVNDIIKKDNISVNNIDDIKEISNDISEILINPTNTDNFIQSVSYIPICRNKIEDIFVKILVFKILIIRLECSEKQGCPGSKISIGEEGLCITNYEQLYNLFISKEEKDSIIKQLCDTYIEYIKNSIDSSISQITLEEFFYGKILQISEYISDGIIAMNLGKIKIKNMDGKYIGIYERQGKSSNTYTSYYNLETGEDILQNKSELEISKIISEFKSIKQEYSLNCNTTKERFIPIPKKKPLTIRRPRTSINSRGVESTSVGGYLNKSKKYNKINKKTIKTIKNI